MGANIQYPYHELPMISTDDRLGYWALEGILELMDEEMKKTNPSSGKKGTMFTLNCGKPPKKK